MEGKYVMNPMEQKLVNALRSGNYHQTMGQLKYGNNFCCLGVACDIFNPNNWKMDTYSDDGYTAYKVLPDRIKESLGWKTHRGLTLIASRKEEIPYHYFELTELNDAGLTFPQIADIIEAGLVD